MHTFKLYILQHIQTVKLGNFTHGLTFSQAHVRNDSLEVLYYILLRIQQKIFTKPSLSIQLERFIPECHHKFCVSNIGKVICWFSYIHTTHTEICRKTVVFYTPLSRTNMEDTLGNDTINMAEKCSFTFLSNYSNGQIDWYGSEFESEINIYFLFTSL